MSTNGNLDDRVDDSTSIKIKSGSDEWLLSYSDLVTVLLCFFIMFFVIKAREQEKSFQAMLKGPKEQDRQKLIAISEELNASLQNQKVDLKMFDNHIAMNVRNNLFEASSYELTLDGKYLFTQLAAVSFNYMPSIQLQLSISTEGSRLDELSQKRINAIRDYLVEMGLQQELVTLGTFPRSTRDPASDDELPKDEVKIFISKNLNQVSGHEK